MSARKSPPSDFRKILERLSHQHSSREVFDAFTRFSACALAMQTREAEYLEEAKRWEKPDLELFAEAFGALVLEMESRPFEDLIGGCYMEFALSSKGSSGMESSTLRSPSVTSWRGLRSATWNQCRLKDRSRFANRPAVQGR